MRLDAVEEAEQSVDDRLMAFLDETHLPFVGEPRLFIKQLAKRTGIDTRSLAQAIPRLHAKRKIAVLKAGGQDYFFYMGIAAKGVMFEFDDYEDLWGKYGGRIKAFY